jgi:bisphosphoglycerate-dependent phosphoglycerate mutase
VMKLEDISPDEIVKLEIATGDPLMYECSEGKIQRTV